MLLLSTSSLQGYGIHKIFLIAKKIGFAGLDLSLTNENLDLWDGDYLNSLCEETGIKILSITAPSKGLKEENINKIVAIAKKLNSQLITFSPPYFKDSNASGFLSCIQKIKKETNLSIAIKNIEQEFLLLIIPKYKNSSLVDIKKITGDTALDVSSIEPSGGMDIIKALKILGNSIKNVYFSDRQGSKAGLLPGDAGGGISYLPLESFLIKLKTTGYNGFISIKVDPTTLGVGNEEEVIQNINLIIEYYKKHFVNYK